MIKHYALDGLTKALNAYLHLDDQTKNRLRTLQNKIIKIELIPLGHYYCFFDQQGIKLTTDNTLEPDTVLKGTPLQLLNVLLSKDKKTAFFSNNLIIEG